MPKKVSDKQRLLRDARRNRKSWDDSSHEYQKEHGRHLDGTKALAWGIWRIPERELKVLGDVRGKRMLELGSGAAQWSKALRRKGADPIALDGSFNQLLHAKAGRSSSSIPVVQADGELLPFREESFDIVFCDYGAMSFADPGVTVPEVARVLRRKGLLAFSTTTPFLSVCWPDKEPEVTTTLSYSYFGMKRFVWSDDDTVDYQLPYGEWIRLFRSNGFVIEDLIEVQPPKGAKSSFGGRPLRWAKRWPAEMIWKVRKE
jgi:SAM-dependent methyltransferase